MARQGTPHDEYDLLEQVGTGSFGTVHRAQHKATHQVVCLFLFLLSPHNTHTHTHTHTLTVVITTHTIRNAIYRIELCSCGVPWLGCHQGDEADESFSRIHQHA